MNKNNVGPKDYLIFLRQVAAFLNADFVREAEEFDLGQWELPFEAVLLRLMEGPPRCEGINMGLVEKLAAQAGLVGEGVLTPDTWPRFVRWYGAPVS